MPASFTERRNARAYWSTAFGLAAALIVAAASPAPAQPDSSDAEQGESAPAKAGVDLVVRVRDDGGEPVRGASVWVRAGDGWVEGQSDIAGNADFDALPVGKTRIQVVATGWNSSGSSVDLDGREVKVEVALDRRAAPETRADEAPQAEADDAGADGDDSSAKR